ncbi:hypothetical protein HaLaN_30871, partial [Haematococcus lacustris]
MFYRIDNLLTLELVIKHCEIVRDIIKYYTLSSCLAQQVEVNKPALCSAVTDANFLRPERTAAQQQRAGSIRAVVLSPNFWAENELLVHTMRPVVQLEIDLQTDNANMADAYY